MCLERRCEPSNLSAKENGSLLAELWPVDSAASATAAARTFRRHNSPSEVSAAKIWQKFGSVPLVKHRLFGKMLSGNLISHISLAMKWFITNCKRFQAAQLNRARLRKCSEKSWQLNTVTPELGTRMAHRAKMYTRTKIKSPGIKGFNLLTILDHAYVSRTLSTARGR